MTMTLQQGKINCHKVVTKYLKYFPILQIISGKGSLRGVEWEDIRKLMGDIIVCPQRCIFCLYLNFGDRFSSYWRVLSPSGRPTIDCRVSLF